VHITETIPGSDAEFVSLLAPLQLFRAAADNCLHQAEPSLLEEENTLQATSGLQDDKKFKAKRIEAPPTDQSQPPKRIEAPPTNQSQPPKRNG
jgi:hypothetical protein